MDPYIKNNILHTSIVKGTPFQLTFDSPDLDITQYTTLRADFKPSRDLNSPPLIRVELGEGISVSPPGEEDGEPTPSTLTISVPYTHTSRIRYEKLYMDLKGHIEGGEPVLLLEAEHDILASTTDL